MKRPFTLLLLPLAAACATDDPRQVRTISNENEFVTGSRIPGKGRGVTVNRQDIEHIRSTAEQPMQETLKDGPPR